MLVYILRENVVGVSAAAVVSVKQRCCYHDVVLFTPDVFSHRDFLHNVRQYGRCHYGCRVLPGVPECFWQRCSRCIFLLFIQQCQFAVKFIGPRSFEVAHGGSSACLMLAIDTIWVIVRALHVLIPLFDCVSGPRISKIPAEPNNVSPAEVCCVPCNQKLVSYKDMGPTHRPLVATGSKSPIVSLVMNCI